MDKQFISYKKLIDILAAHEARHGRILAAEDIQFNGRYMYLDDGTRQEQITEVEYLVEPSPTTLSEYGTAAARAQKAFPRFTWKAAGSQAAFALFDVPDPLSEERVLVLREKIKVNPNVEGRIIERGVSLTLYDGLIWSTAKPLLSASAPAAEKLEGTMGWGWNAAYGALESNWNATSLRLGLPTWYMLGWKDHCKGTSPEVLARLKKHWPEFDWLACPELDYRWVGLVGDGLFVDVNLGIKGYMASLRKGDGYRNVLIGTDDRYATPEYPVRLVCMLWHRLLDNHALLDSRRPSKSEDELARGM